MIVDYHATPFTHEMRRSRSGSNAERPEGAFLTARVGGKMTASLRKVHSYRPLKKLGLPADRRTTAARRSQAQQIVPLNQEPQPRATGAAAVGAE